MKYKAIIFDMDGTIVDSDHIWDTVTRELILSKVADAQEHHLEEIQNKVKGLALHASCHVIKEYFDLEHELVHLIAEKKQRALLKYQEQIHFIEGFLDFLLKVQATELKIGIATNADDHTLEASIKKLKLDVIFGEHIYNITHVNNKHKPAPDLYLHAAGKLGIDPKDCIAIEDSHHGIRAAVDAGMFCIGINTSKNREHLKESHLIIEHYDEICLKTLLYNKTDKK